MVSTNLTNDLNPTYLEEPAEYKFRAFRRMKTASNPDQINVDRKQ